MAALAVAIVMMSACKASPKKKFSMVTAVDSQTVIVSSSDGVVCRYDLAKQAYRWCRNVDDLYRHPVVAGPSVAVPRHRTDVLFLNLEDGQTTATVPLPEPTDDIFLIADSDEVVTVYAKNTIGYDAATGKQRWRQERTAFQHYSPRNGAHPPGLSTWLTLEDTYRHSDPWNSAPEPRCHLGRNLVVGQLDIDDKMHESSTIQFFDLVTGVAGPRIGVPRYVDWCAELLDEVAILRTSNWEQTLFKVATFDGKTVTPWMPVQKRDLPATPRPYDLTWLPLATGQVGIVDPFDRSLFQEMQLPFNLNLEVRGSLLRNSYGYRAADSGAWLARRNGTAEKIASGEFAVWQQGDDITAFELPLNAEHQASTLQVTRCDLNSCTVEVQQFP